MQSAALANLGIAGAASFVPFGNLLHLGFERRRRI
jgi:hypothetical protein